MIRTVEDGCGLVHQEIERRQNVHGVSPPTSSSAAVPKSNSIVAANEGSSSSDTTDIGACILYDRCVYACRSVCFMNVMRDLLHQTRTGLEAH